MVNLVTGRNCAFAAISLKATRPNSIVTVTPVTVGISSVAFAVIFLAAETLAC